MSTPLSGATIAALPPGSAGFASAMYNSSRQVGGVLGITLLGVIVAAHQAARSAAAGLAFTHGLQRALLVSGLALLASAVLSAILMPRKPRPSGGPDPGPGTPRRDRPARLARRLP
jgi:sugar phosphate permease